MVQRDKDIVYYMSQIEKLRDILLNKNLAVCNSIANGEFDQKKLFKYFKASAREIRKLKKSHCSLSAEPKLTKDERRDQYQQNERDKLITRIEQIKNDKKWSKMEDEQDELISRLNQLQPVKVPDPDIEYYDKLEELERERDEYFEEKDYYHDTFEEMEQERNKYFEEKDRRERNLDLEVLEECEEIQDELITFLDKKRKSTKEIIEKNDQFEQALHQKLGHLQNRLEVQTKCYVIFGNLQFLRDKLIKRRKINYGVVYIRSAIIQAQLDLFSIVRKIE